MFASAVTMLLFSLANRYWAILLLAVLAGLATETYRPAAAALLTDLVDASNRVTAFAGYRIAINAGWAIGPAVGGFLARHSYTWLFVGDAVTSVLFGLIAWSALPAGLRLSEAQKVSFRLSVQTIARDVRFLRVLVASFLVGVIFMQTTTTFGLQIKNGGYSEAVFGAMLSLNGVMIILFELPLTVWTRRFPAVGMIAAGYFLCGVGFALNILGNHIWIYALSMFVFTIGEMISLPVWSAYVAELAPASMRGRYMGANGLTWALSLIVGPTAGLALFALHPNALWLASGLCGTLAAVILLKKQRPAPIAAGVADSTTA
jgi:MFS family permease